MSKKSAKTPSSPADFASALTELEQLVERMEQGQLPLEDTLQHFEKGVALVRFCQKSLETAEQQVKILLEKNGDVTLTSYADDNALNNQ